MLKDSAQKKSNKIENQGSKWFYFLLVILFIQVLSEIIVLSTNLLELYHFGIGLSIIVVSFHLYLLIKTHQLKKIAWKVNVSISVFLILLLVANVIITLYGYFNNYVPIIQKASSSEVEHFFNYSPLFNFSNFTRYLLINILALSILLKEEILKAFKIDTTYKINILKNSILISVFFNVLILATAYFLLFYQ